MNKRKEQLLQNQDDENLALLDSDRVKQEKDMNSEVYKTVETGEGGKKDIEVKKSLMSDCSDRAFSDSENSADEGNTTVNYKRKQGMGERSSAGGESGKNEEEYV